MRIINKLDRNENQEWESINGIKKKNVPAIACNKQDKKKNTVLNDVPSLSQITRKPLLIAIIRSKINGVDRVCTNTHNKIVCFGTNTVYTIDFLFNGCK